MKSEGTTATRELAETGLETENSHSRKPLTPAVQIENRLCLVEGSENNIIRRAVGDQTQIEVGQRGTTCLHQSSRSL